MSRPILAQPNSRLLSLPPEVRLQIWDDFLEETQIWVHTPSHEHNHYRCKYIDEDSDSEIESHSVISPRYPAYFINQPNLIRVCRQVYLEISNRWMSRVTFYCPSQLALLNLLRFLNFNGVRAANRIVVTCDLKLVVEVGTAKDDEKDDSSESIETSISSSASELVLTAASASVPSIGGIRRRRCADIHLSQIIAAFPITILYLEVLNDCYSGAESVISLDFAALTAFKWGSLYFVTSREGPTRKIHLASITQKLHELTGRKPPLWIASECDLERTWLSEAFEVWKRPRWYTEDGMVLCLDWEFMDELLPDRAAAIEKLGTGQWAAGIRMVRNWDLMEAQTLRVGFGLYTRVQVINDDPDAFLARLQSRETQTSLADGLDRRDPRQLP